MHKSLIFIKQQKNPKTTNPSSFPLKISLYISVPTLPWFPTADKAINRNSTEGSANYDCKHGLWITER